MIHKPTAFFLLALAALSACKGASFKGTGKSKDGTPPPTSDSNPGKEVSTDPSKSGNPAKPPEGSERPITNAPSSGNPTQSNPTQSGPSLPGKVPPATPEVVLIPTGALERCDTARPAFCSRSILASPLRAATALEGDTNGIQFSAKNADQKHWQSIAITGSCLSSSSFADTEWSNVKFDANELILSNFSKSRWFSSRLYNVDARLSDFSRSYLQNTRFESSCFAGANLSASEMENVAFNGTNAEGSNFSNMKIIGRFEIKYAKLKSANFSGSVFQGPASFQDSDLRYANLQNMKFENSVDWTGAQLGGATWLDGRKCKENSVGSCL